MNQLWVRIDVRKTDFDSDKELQGLIGTAYDVDEIDNVLSFTDANGYPGSTDCIVNHCIKAGIAFDRWCEADLECAAQYRIFRPGKDPIDAFVDVDIEGRPYVCCTTITEILANETLDDTEKVRQLMSYSKKVDFPCPLISSYRSLREIAG